LINAELRKAGLPPCSLATQSQSKGTKMISMAPRSDQPSRVFPTIVSEGVAERGRQQQEALHFHEVAERRRDFS